MSKNTNFILNTFFYALAVFMGFRIYQATVKSEQFFYDLIIVAIIVAVQVFAPSRRATRTLRLKAGSASDFWSDFLKLLKEVDFKPTCQMENLYFFEQRWVGMSHNLTLKKCADDQWELEYPALFDKRVRKYLGAYKIINDLADTPTL